MIYIWALIVGVYESIWRRTHGGGPISDWYKKHVQPWLKINGRVIETILNLGVFFCVGFFLRHLVWWQAIIFDLIVWAFWDITFGMYMGIGMHPYPDEKDRDEYKRQYPVVWILDAIFKDDGDPIYGRYGMVYDFCGMWIRFTYPLVPLLFLPTFTPWLLCLGLLTAINYYLNVWVWKWWDAEYTTGFMAGVFFVLL